MADDNAQAGDNAEYIKIKVVGQDNNEVHFRGKFGTSMAKLKKSYADRTGVSVNSLRFLFDGRLINDEDIPKTLEMEDDFVESIRSCAEFWAVRKATGTAMRSQFSEN